MLVDSHCHLDFPDFTKDLDQVLQRAEDAGVATMLTIGTKISTFPAVRALAERFNHIWCSVGIHPHEAEREGAIDRDRLVALAEHPKVVGIGETGLDYFYEEAPREAQRKNFEVHMDAARITGLPLIVHTRDADADTIALLQTAQAKGAFKGVIHCFTAGAELARAALDFGFYISISGIVTFKNAENLRQVVKNIPLERLLVETDSPYLAPIPMRGKRNEPGFVRHTATALAALLGISSDVLAAKTSENFFTLFSKVQRI